VLFDGLRAHNRAIARVKAVWAKLAECELLSSVAPGTCQTRTGAGRGSLIEVANVLFDGLCACDRAIVRVRALWAKLAEREPPGLGFDWEMPKNDAIR
jgi:hypothetical protein